MYSWAPLQQNFVVNYINPTTLDFKLQELVLNFDFYSYLRIHAKFAEYC